MCKLKCICFLIVISTVFVSNGQSFNFDVDVESKPYNDIHKFDEKNTIGIKKTVRLKTDLTNVERTDTLAIYSYNSEGNEIVKIGFKRNKRNSLTLTEWNGSLKTSIKYIAADYYSSIVNNYDESNNLIQTLDITIRKGDTTAFLCKQFTYDANNNLIEKLLYRAQLRKNLFKQYSQRALFEYDINGNLIEHRHFSGNNKTQPISNYYYTDQLLDSIIRVYHSNSKEDKYDCSHFKYNQNGKLIYKIEPINIELSSESDDIKMDEYSYDSEGFLKHACAIRDQEVIAEVDYHYKNGLINEVIADNKNPEFVSSIYYFHSNRISEIRVVYIRNKNNHILSEERYFDGHLSAIYTSVYTYY